MNLYDINFSHDGDTMAVDLTADVVAQFVSAGLLSHWDDNRVRGLYGSGVFGQLTIHFDWNMSWDDVAGSMDGAREGLFIWDANGYRVTDLYDEADEAVTRFGAAVERIKESGLYWNDAERAMSVLDRYARLLGLRMDARYLNGSTQSEWLRVIAVWDADKTQCYVLTEMADYWAGNVYGYTLTVDSPLQGWDSYDESLWGIVGDQWVMSAVADELDSALAHHSTAVTELRAQLS